MAAVGAPVRAPVAVACRVLGFSTQGYYKWLKQPVAARGAEEQELISVLHQLQGDDPEGGYRVLADDITEHRTREGKVYLCAIKDVFSNRIVGYSIDTRMKARIIVNALEMAVAHRGRPTGVIVHSDRGSQFRSRRFLKALKRHGLRGSMGRVGACGDNAAMESFFALLHKNVLDRRCWSTREELRLAIVSWIEGKYHRKRRQRRLGKLTPVEFELIMKPTTTLAA